MTKARKIDNSGRIAALKLSACFEHGIYLMRDAVARNEFSGEISLLAFFENKNEWKPARRSRC